MFNLFKKFTPSFQNIVRNYAIDVWYDRESEKDFRNKVKFFKERFEKELITFYRSKGFKIDFKEIKSISSQWEIEQIILAQRITEDIKKKESKVISAKIEELKQEREELYKEASKPSSKKEFVQVIKSLSAGKIDHDFLKKTNQLGDESAFDLVSKVNNLVIKNNSDNSVFRWVTQGDKLVRPTHRKLNKLVFSWYNLPKIDGKEVEPGSEWGCRCYGIITTGKPLKNFEIKS